MIKEKLNQLLEWMVVFLLSIMLLSVLWGVVSRYIFANQSSWTDELARFMLIWVSILGAAYISGKNEHIAIDLLPQSLSIRTKLKLEILCAIIISVFVFVVFLIGGSRYVYISFKLGQASAALFLPMGYVYLVMPIAGVIVIYYKIFDAIHANRKLKLIE
ncbi:TRAP transporter small permease [Gillisia sp. M10.2A]|uniref:TRAP transporter small permease n=1 Tax=Gillisia lutea TaxID=2909668 RepID=A0ABS9EE21_9FLAO|nr:TRAP transporter small permease [Gillisia lutea]MCF4101096.1 TRAP transporter small permease [Gillisia lutea]